ncbi:GH3 auxin-responsive promoter family protein [Chloroflexota bacterium]
MLSKDKYFQTLNEDELWIRYCGFLDLSIDEFMNIQHELLMDEIRLVSESLLGKKIMNNKKPQSVDEFRQLVPLTTHDDYEPYLGEKNEDALAIKPYAWCHSAGRSGHFKWIPQSSEFLERAAKNFLASFILASTKEKGRVNLSPGFRFLPILAPPPYASGILLRALAETVHVEVMPPLETMETLEFQARMEKAFQMALKNGVEVIGALGSVLVKVGEGFEERRRKSKLSLSMLNLQVILRLLRAIWRSKREKRPILPKDLWPAKAIVTGGVDTSIYKQDICRYWGSEPYEFYVCAEGCVVATQTWARKGMVFLPDAVFTEFIPYEPGVEKRENRPNKANTLLLNELEAGKSYEVIITQLYGMPLLRCRMKDVVKVIALTDEENGVNLPHFIFQCRIGETINLGGLCDLDEKTIWQAITDSGIKCVDWSARKDYEQSQTFLRLYIELKESLEADKIEGLIDEQLKNADTDYGDLDYYLNLQPIRITMLSQGTFERYREEKVKEGADLAHLKPAHMNAPDAIIEHLLELSDADVTKGIN